MAELPKDILRDVVIDKLICGHTLNKEEADYYNQHKDVSDFQMDLQLLKDLQGPLLIENKSLLKAQLIEKEQQILDSKNPIRLMPALAVAASLVALIAVSFLFWPSQTNTELFASHYEAYPSIINPIVKGEQTRRALLDEAMVKYQESNFIQAKELLNNLPLQSDTVLFYLAMSEIELDQPNEALINLESIDSQASRFYQESQWYRALLYVKSGQNEKARMQLQQIVNTKVHPYLAEAARFMREIK